MSNASYNRENNSFLGSLLAILAVVALVAAAVFGYMWFNEDSGTSTVINVPAVEKVQPIEAPAAPAIENPAE